MEIVLFRRANHHKIGIDLSTLKHGYSHLKAQRMEFKSIRYAALFMGAWGHRP